MPAMDVVHADVVPRMVVIVGPERKPPDDRGIPGVTDGEAEVAGAARVGEGDERGAPDRPDRGMHNVNDIGRDPAPVIAGSVDPASVVVGDPAPGLIGDPCPTERLAPDPAPVAVGCPVDHRHTRGPDAPVLFDFDPIAVLLEVAVAGDARGDVLAADHGRGHGIAHIAPAVEVVIGCHIRHLQLRRHGGRIEGEALTTLDADRVVLPDGDQGVAAVDQHIGGAFRRDIDSQRGEFLGGDDEPGAGQVHRWPGILDLPCLDGDAALEDLQMDQLIVQGAEGDEGILPEPDDDIVFQLDLGLCADAGKELVACDQGEVDLCGGPIVLMNPQAVDRAFHKGDPSEPDRDLILDRHGCRLVNRFRFGGQPVRKGARNQDGCSQPVLDEGYGEMAFHR